MTKSYLTLMLSANLPVRNDTMSKDKYSVIFCLFSIIKWKQINVLIRYINIIYTYFDKRETRDGYVVFPSNLSFLLYKISYLLVYL